MAAYKIVAASALMVGMAQGHLLSNFVSKTATATKEVVEIPASGGTRPVGAFGIATGNVSVLLRGART